VGVVRGPCVISGPVAAAVRPKVRRRAIKHAAAGCGTTTHPAGGGTTTHPSGRATTSHSAGRGITTHAADRGASTRPAALARDKHDGGADTGQIDREGTG